MYRTTLIPLVLLLVALATGCSRPDHQGTIRQKFNEGIGYLCRGQVDACQPLVDPLFVRAQGTDAVKIRLGIIVTLFKLGQISEADVRVDGIRMGADQKTAEVLFSVLDKAKGVWNSQNPVKWVLHEGQWYWTF